MDGKADETDAMPKCVAFQLLQIGAMFRRERSSLRDVHLPMQNVHAVDAERGGFLDHGFDRDLRGAEMPVGVRRDGELNRRGSRRRSRCGDCNAGAPKLTTAAPVAANDVDKKSRRETE